VAALVAGRPGVGAVGAGRARPRRGAWLDRLSLQAGRPDLAQFAGAALAAVLGHLSAATVGAVLASRRPRHPVGWLLLAFALSLTASGVIASYTAYGHLTRPGALPAAGGVARYYPTGPTALALLALVLLTPTGSPPSPRWRWCAWVTAAAPAGLLLAVTTLAVVVAGGSLVVRFRRATGVERQQLRWVALAAALMSLAALVVLAALALGLPLLVDWAAAVCAVVLPLATGAAILRYRLYDLARIVSRTLAYGLLPLLLAAATPRWSWASASCCPRTPAWWSPAPPWRSPPPSSPPAAASRTWSTGASTATATTPP
jgi:hypothetical protein